MKFIVIFIVIIFLIMFMPLYFDFTYDNSNKQKLIAKLRILFAKGPSIVKTVINEDNEISLYICGIKVIKNKDIKDKTTEKSGEIEKSKESKHLNKDTENDKGVFEKINYFKEVIEKSSNIVLGILKSLKLIKLSVLGVFGFNDPALTAMFNGFVNATVYSLIAVLLTVTDLSDIDVKIWPDFNERKKDVKLNCIILFRIAYIIIAGAKAMFKNKKLVEAKSTN